MIKLEIPEKRTAMLSVRVSPDNKTKIQQIAKDYDMSISELVIRAINDFQRDEVIEDEEVNREEATDEVIKL